MKDSYYFPHDYHARHDPKNERLRMEIGPVGDGIYWDIVEMLYEESGYLSLKTIPSIAKSLNTTEELVTKVVRESKLFRIRGGKFYSESLLARLKHINVKRRKARISGKFGGLAKAKRTLSERLPIKESKVKESKDNKVNIIPPSIEEVINYCKERNKGVDPNKWYNHYQSNGWMVGRNKMKDWQACVRKWEQSDFNPTTLKPAGKTPAKLRVITMRTAKIPDADIKTELLAGGYTEAEIDEALGKAH